VSLGAAPDEVELSAKLQLTVNTADGLQPAFPPVLSSKSCCIAKYIFVGVQIRLS
jgi:hypothetical protein